MANLIKCRMCGAAQAPSARTCMECGCENPHQSDFQMKRFFGGLLLGAGGLYIGYRALANDGAWWSWLIAAFLIAAAVYSFYEMATGKDSN